MFSYVGDSLALLQIMKAYTAKHAVRVSSEVIEAIGGQVHNSYAHINRSTDSPVLSIAKKFHLCLRLSFLIP